MNDIKILASLAILVNVVYIFCIRKAMKQSNMRADNYKEPHPHCSGMYSAYTKFLPFGLLKIVHWVIPAFHANLYRITDPDDNQKFLMACWFGIYFCLWISYVKNTRFPSTDYGVGSGSNRFLFVMDFVVYGSGIVSYSVTYFSANPWSGHFVKKATDVARFYSVTYVSANPWTGHFIRKVSLVAIFFLLCSMFANVQLVFKYCGFSTFCQKFDRISVNVSINVTKNDNQDSNSDSAVTKTSENGAPDGQEKKKDHNEKEAEKGLDYIDI